MRRLVNGLLVVLLTLPGVEVHAAALSLFAPGDIVLTNCRQIYSKGSVIAPVDEGYTIHFPKDSGPINCPPFRWHHEFVVPFQSVTDYRLKFFGGLKDDIVFRTGETVILTFDADPRVVKSRKQVEVEARITDISHIGAIAVELISRDAEGAAMFWQWVGRNYIDVRHKALEAEIDRRSR
ncbi:MAG: hypothetical protein KGZ80_04450 [Methylomonas sp.]|nr:hypothetical protein [Methylomonas sp.]PPD22056.1 MAG: hypothetical protein CTY23_03085 [Methylomonas sp.]PPD25248.1 MAG: hypothetical protein CTY22_09375 [Methylomonas sp.]PPD35199.1 MAG: hypothetical protein CTY21_09375 [Methylomonas sp.]PPD42456.1 MAG: hypothetical protein CTY17_01585 [Methylomonas sp.]